MQVSSFPDVLKFSALRDRGAELKRGVEDAYRELTTGRLSKVDATRNLNGRLGDAHLIRRQIDQIDTKNSSFALSLGRADVVEKSLDLVIESIGSLPETLGAAVGLGDDQSLELSAEQARSSLDQVVSSLNVRYGQRYLFGGDAVSAAPVASGSDIIAAVETAVAGATTAAEVTLALDAFFAPGGGYETEVYQGGTGDLPAIELAEGDRVALEPRADEQAFRDTIRGLATASIAQGLGLERRERDVIIAEAGSYMSAGIDGTAKTIASVGLAGQRIETAQARNNAEQAVLMETYGVMTGADQLAAASRAQELEALLQTTYTVTARLSALNFNNFIR
ncbi:MAG: flagellin [Pseudomonadota bacterium]